MSGAAPSRSTDRVSGTSASTRGSTASRRSRTSCAARWRRVRRTSQASCRRERRCSAGSDADDRAGARRAGRRPRRQDVVVGVHRRRRPRARALRLLVRALPPLVGRLRRRPCAAAAASPSSASTWSTCRRSTRSGARSRKGRNNTLDGRSRRPRQPVGDRQRAGGHTRSTRSSARSTTSSGSSRGRENAPDRDRARLRDPVLARPPVAEAAPGVVPPPPGRDAQVRREPAEALPGHLQRQLRLRGLARSLGGAARRRPRLGRARRHRLPRRQPAHEADRVLGVADRRGARRDTPT